MLPFSSFSRWIYASMVGVLEILKFLKVGIFFLEYLRVFERTQTSMNFTV
uniref:Uncharacterized protein n=1 Tax=Parascaris univalens TaxID=6257 RepID=A0A915AZK0_PARUN